MDFPICAFMKQVLKEEYIIRCKILYNLSIHIEKLDTECIIHHSLRCKYISIINNIIKELNDTYNENVREIKSIELTSTIKTFKKGCNFYNLMNSHIKILIKKLYDDYYKKNSGPLITLNEFKNVIFIPGNTFIYDIGGIDNAMAEFYNSIENSLVLIKFVEEFQDVKKILRLNKFDEIDISILKLTSNIGFGKFEDVFKLFIGPNYKDIFNINSNNSILNNYLEPYQKDKSIKISLSSLDKKINNSFILFDLLKKCFIPIKTIIKNNKKKSNEVYETGIKINKKEFTGKPNKENSNKFKYEILLDNCYKVTIKTKIPGIIIIHLGYFNYDTLNTLIRTAKINTYYLFNISLL